MKLRLFYTFLGVAMQAFTIATGLKYGLLHISAGQEVIVGVLALLIAAACTTKKI